MKEPLAEQPDFETALSELEQIVERLEGEELRLEEALELFERGIRLVRYCSQLLESMELRVRQVTVTEDGEVQEEAFLSDENASEETTG
ncbi:MAG: exodeoxyribonuclease 7 small subunit [Candidatus Poribacteria bacterium]|nr:MAG: exodeoxyribonuclease 7 small subunit [Candidatus Poribacteria bacterium]